jgi:hypothetical protein
MRHRQRSNSVDNGEAAEGERHRAALCWLGPESVCVRDHLRIVVLPISSISSLDRPMMIAGGACAKRIRVTSVLQGPCGPRRSAAREGGLAPPKPDGRRRVRRSGRIHGQTRSGLDSLGHMPNPRTSTSRSLTDVPWPHPRIPPSDTHTARMGATPAVRRLPGSLPSSRPS